MPSTRGTATLVLRSACWNVTENSAAENVVVGVPVTQPVGDAEDPRDAVHLPESSLDRGVSYDDELGILAVAARRCLEREFEQFMIKASSTGSGLRRRMERWVRIASASGMCSSVRPPQVRGEARLVMGGGPVGLSYGTSLAHDSDASAWRHLEDHMRLLFPVLRDVRVTHRWGGPFSLTLVSHRPSATSGTSVPCMRSAASAMACRRRIRTPSCSRISFSSAAARIPRARS